MEYNYFVFNEETHTKPLQHFILGGVLSGEKLIELKIRVIYEWVMLMRYVELKKLLGLVEICFFVCFFWVFGFFDYFGDSIVH